MKHKLLILGAGGHGRCIAEVAALTGEYLQVDFLDDSWAPDTVQHLSIIGRIEHLALHQHDYSHVIIGVGNNSVREKLQDQVVAQGMNLASIIHPKAFISPTAHVGRGTVVFAGVVIGSNTRIGENVIVNCNSTIDHDGFVDDFAHLGVGVQLAGSCHIGKGVFIQAGSCAGFGAIAEPYAIFAPGSILKSRA